MRNKLFQISLTLVFLAGTMALFQFTNFDIWCQDHIYNFSTHRWPIEKKDVVPRILLYTGPKVVMGIAGGLILLWLLVPQHRRPAVMRAWTLPWSSRQLWGFLLCLAIAPSVIGLMKSRSDLYCPWDVDRYGGERPHLRFFDPIPKDYPPNCGRCFPAGHASGGFALLALGVLARTQRGRITGYAIGLTAGWSMGLYQMFKGAHFLSHTLVTMWLALLIAQIIGLWLGREKPAATTATSTSAGAA